MIAAGIDAGQFASSPDGYVITALVAVNIAMVAWWLRKQDRIADTHTTALTEVGKTLAVLIADRDDMKPALREAINDIDDLQAAVAVLQMWRESREKQNELDHQAFVDYVRRSGFVTGGPAGVSH